MKRYDIKGKVAFVTGANRGIGKAITEALFANGVSKVYAAVRDLSSADPLVEAHGRQVVPLEFDLTSDDVVRAAAADARDTHIVVNNAGVLRPAAPLAEDAVEALRFEIENNVAGLIRTARAFAPILDANGGGAFVQLNSVASLRCSPDFASYCASKAAAYSITQALRLQLGNRGTAVYSVHPGPIATDMAKKAGLEDIAEPPKVVADAIIQAFRTGTFHVYPDAMARRLGEAYRSFAENVIEADDGEGADGEDDAAEQ